MPSQPQADSKLLVVGIGASAGGLAALRRFFTNVPTPSDTAFVVIMHLDPNRHSSLAELLGAETELTVEQVTGRTKLEPGHVFVIPPARSLSIEDSHLILEEFERPRGRRAPIDLFFRSLASLENRSVGIVLSGTGTDGTVGLKSIKERGGLVIAQDPREAEYDSMPRSAIATRLVDFVLPVEEMGAQLLKYRETGERIQVPDQPDQLGEDGNEALDTILYTLKRHTGHDFSSYKRSTVLRRIARRMQMNHLDNLEAYAGYLDSQGDESERLLKNLLISVTHFFRDADAWEALEHQVVPKLLEDRADDGAVRIWVPGCATGEEAYSIGMVMLEGFDATDRRTALQVFASDLDEASLAYAREAVYPEAIAADVSEARLRQFFIEEGDHFRVRQELREKVLFAAHSLLKDPPFSRLDLISCRNLLIYLDSDLQDRVFRLFHYALPPGGFLFLGGAETIDAGNGLFEPIDKRHKIFRRSDTAHPPRLPAFEPRERLLASGTHGPPTDAVSPPAPLERHRRMLERHAPPSLLVDREFRIVHLSDNAGRYLLHAGGTPTNDLLTQVRPELSAELRQALVEGFHEQRNITTPPIEVGFNGETSWVQGYVRIGSPSTGTEDHALVVFAESNAPRQGLSGDERVGELGDDERVQRLEAEAARLRARLRALTEEHQSTREEMRAANEELQSINEEYKSTAEELETSKEELQSVNEELETVNQELKTKIDEVTLANSDLQNLLASTEIGTLFLDKNFGIQRFTPSVTRLYNIQSSDRGRPISDLTSHVDYPGLLGDIEHVLEELVTVEREIATDADEWFLVRMRPYRTVDDRIDGVVITYVDITEKKIAQLELERLTEALEERVDQRTRQVRDLAASLSIAEHEERHRLSSVLHDDLQQVLYGTRLKLALGREAAGSAAAGDAGEEHLQEAEGMIAEAIEMTRHLSVDLSPPVLQREGLVEAIRWLGDQMSERHDLTVEVEAAESFRTSDKLRVLLFRSIRELLFNVVKHANIDTATVAVSSSEPGWLMIRVSDLGGGFDVEAAFSRRTEGMGLISMRDRLSLIDARMEIRSEFGSGTEVLIHVPLSEPE